MNFLEKVHNQLALSIIKPTEIKSYSFGTGFLWVLGGLPFLSHEKALLCGIGMDKVKDKALCKAISGYVELIAKSQREDHRETLIGQDADEGFAAYPVLYPSSLEKCQENSYFEALEGFVWKAFWSDSSLGYTSEFYVDDLAKQLGFEFCKMIYPRINSDIVIAYAVGKVGSKGIVVGGGASYCHKYATEKACAEMSRNYFLLTRFDDRLSAFNHKKVRNLGALAEDGDRFYRRRCSFNSEKILQIPEPVIDCFVPHPYEKLFHVWRTKFNG